MLSQITILLISFAINTFLVLVTIILCFYLGRQLIDDEFKHQRFVAGENGSVDLVNTPLTTRIKRIFKIGSNDNTTQTQHQLRIFGS